MFGNPGPAPAPAARPGRSHAPVPSARWVRRVVTQSGLHAFEAVRAHEGRRDPSVARLRASGVQDYSTPSAVHSGLCLIAFFRSAARRMGLAAGCLMTLATHVHAQIAAMPPWAEIV